MRASRLSLAGTISLVLLGSVSSVTVALDEATDPDATAVLSGAVPSSGCGASVVDPGSSEGSIAVDDLERTYYVRASPAHDGHTPLPLIIALHGYGAPDQFTPLAYEPWDAWVDEEGVVVVSPFGRGGMERWIFELDEPDLDLTRSNPDISFISELIDRLGEELCLDLSRVYAMGCSNGGWAALALACALEEEIAAVAAVAGVFDCGAACRLGRPVPTLAVYGTDDPIVPYGGGLGGLRWAETDKPGHDFGSLPWAAHPMWGPTIPERVASIAERNGCETAPQVVPLGTEVERRTYPCPPGAGVEFVVVEGGGHTWPGWTLPAWLSHLGYSTMEVDAFDLALEFFRQHPMPAD